MTRNDELAATPPTPSSQFGRSAWLVTGAGALASSVLITVSNKFRFQNNGEFFVNYMGCMIGFVFYVWSITLAVRAIRRGENKRMPIALLWFALFGPALLGMVVIALAIGG